MLRCEGAKGYDPDAVSTATGLRCLDKSLTQQHHAEEVDINTIVRRFGLDGQLPQGVRMPVYGDFVGIDNCHDAMNAVRMAGESFMEMPARVRARFDNDPAKFVDFCLDENNAAEAAELGLVRPEVLERAKAAPVAAPAAVGAPKDAPVVASPPAQ